MSSIYRGLVRNLSLEEFTSRPPPLVGDALEVDDLIQLLFIVEQVYIAVRLLLSTVANALKAKAFLARVRFLLTQSNYRAH